MNARPTAFLLQAKLIVSIMCWTIQHLMLHLMPIIATYQERGGAAAVSMATMWLAQFLRNWAASTTLSGPLDQSQNKWEHFLACSAILIKQASKDISTFFAQALAQNGPIAQTWGNRPQIASGKSPSRFNYAQRCNAPCFPVLTR